MARRKKHRSDSLEHEMRREAPSFANVSLPHFETKQHAHEYAERARALARSAQSEPEDRRRFHPEGPDKPARTRRGTVARMSIAGVSSPKNREAFAAAQRARRESQRFSAFGLSGVGVGGLPPRSKNRTALNARVQFQSPKHVWICVKRKIRKEIMHALKFTGKSVVRRQPRRNMYSDIKC